METSKNPATPVKSTRPARVSMSVPRRRMHTPEIDGYHCHWFLEQNVPQALQGYYEFVQNNEVAVNLQGVSTDGNLDMGTNICIVGNKQGANGKPEMQYLMKIKLEWWNEDQRALEKLNADKLGMIFKGEQIAGAEKADPQDRALRYVDSSRTSIQKPLLNRPIRKGKI